MSARTQLNGMYTYASLFAAAVVGAGASSWWVFAAVLAVLLTLNVHAGRIRHAPRARRY